MGNRLIKVVGFCSVMLYVLVAGVMWGTWVSLARTMTAYDATAFLAVGQHMIDNLATVMAVLMVASLVVGAGWAVLLFRDRRVLAGWLSLIALLGMIMVLVITSLVEVPIDDQIASWTLTTLPSDWEQLRARWAVFHAARTFVSLGAVALAVAAALTIDTATRDHGHSTGGR